MRIKGVRIKTWYIVATVLIISLSTLCAVWLKDSSIVPTPVVVEHKKVVEPPEQPPEEYIPPTPVDYIREIDNPTSEIKGEWLGLCMKDSINNISDFHDQVERDEALSNHFIGFKWSEAKIKHLEKPAKAQVSHRKGDIILPSKKFITLPKGDEYITDGSRMVRTHCCNDIKPADMDDFQPYTAPPKDPKPEVKSYPTPVIWVEPHQSPEIPVLDTFTASYGSYGHSYRSGGGYRYNPPPPPRPPDNPVPEPETWLLFGSGILGLLVRKKFLTRDKK